MNEVSVQTVEIVLDTLRHRAIDAEALWAGLPMARRRDWEVWVEMMARLEAKVGPAALEELFVASGGRRMGHRFVQLANAFLSARDVFSLFARWGLRRSLLVCSGRFAWEGERRARLTIEIDPQRPGSLPTLRFIGGMLRHMSGLQGLPPTIVRIAPDLTPHRAVYELELPVERSLLARARRAGRVIGGVSAALDELEQQATEIASKNAALERQIEAAREHEAWLALALDAGRVGIWRWDPTKRRVLVSPRLAELLALTGPHEVHTDVWRSLIHPDDRERVATTIGDAVGRDEPFELEYRVLQPVGEPIWLRVAGQLVGGASDRHVFGTAVDVTEKRQLDEQLRLADRLIAAGTLAAGVAHEINNPLTYVLGNVELAQRRLREHPAAEVILKDSLAQMREGLERIRDVVADLRSFARPEENVIARLDLAAVCTAAIRLVSSVVRHRAAIITEHSPDTPAVIANESRLGQVIINLIVNASHAMPERAPAAQSTITVRTRRLPSGDAAIEVEDTGTGIAPDVVPRLFDPFFTTKQSGVGTGLGLSVCQSIVASLRGRIEVDTALGRGTTFTVVLPAAPPPLVVPASPRREPSEISGLRILVIDDEPMVRRTLMRMLASHGCEVTEAPGGVVGLELASTGSFDTVLCDLMMPDLDGAMLYDELARRRPPLAAKMVFISGGAVTERTRAFVERPEITLIPKPFALDDLLGALAEAARR